FKGALPHAAARRPPKFILQNEHGKFSNQVKQGVARAGGLA
ncbi:MAG: hypothetical protein ACI9PU_002629, partial [Ascidiaceihabitans sp.]